MQGRLPPWIPGVAYSGRKTGPVDPVDVPGLYGKPLLGERGNCASNDLHRRLEIHRLTLEKQAAKA